MDDFERAVDHLLYVFMQATWNRRKQKYDHKKNITYAHAQAFLIEMGKIKPEECAYKC